MSFFFSKRCERHPFYLLHKKRTLDNFDPSFNIAETGYRALFYIICKNTRTSFEHELIMTNHKKLASKSSLIKTVEIRIPSNYYGILCSRKTEKLLPRETENCHFFLQKAPLFGMPIVSAKKYKFHRLRIIWFGFDAIEHWQIFLFYGSLAKIDARL